jgi:uncharacterized protein (TIGR04255 family)
MTIRARYRRPPITEAVIGLRLAQPHDRVDLEAIRAEFRDRYPNADPRLNFVMHAHPGASTVREDFDGFLLRSSSALESVVAGTKDFSTVRFAPYPGWDAFCAQAMSNYRRLRKLQGYRKVERLGVRFVIRIDIKEPKEINEITLSDYFNVSPDNLSVTPEFNYSEYFISMKINFNPPIEVILQTGAVPPALVGYRSIMLDIDAFIDGNSVPQSEDGIAEAFARLRVAKNDVFERCITDTTRQIFDPDQGQP